MLLSVGRGYYELWVRMHSMLCNMNLTQVELYVFQLFF